MPNPLLDKAEAYAQAGLCIIPIRPDGSKAPEVTAWKQYQEIAPDTETVRRLWGNGHAPGIGVIWGKVSGNGEALDFDAPDLFEPFAALCAEHGLGEVVDTMPLVKTPSGGRHLYYRCTEPVQGNQKLAERLDPTTGAIETLIETRGEGGYTLAPGSPAACHPDNKPYTFLRGRPNTVPTITGEQRSLLLALAASFNEYVKPSAVRDAPKARTEGTGAGLKPGEDYNARGDYESVLERHGWRQMRAAGDKTLWQRPGKTGIGVSATGNYGGNGKFYPFTSNASPFEPNTPYSPFAVYTLLEHGGDYSEAAKQLRTEGYGDPLPSLPQTKAVSESPAPSAEDTALIALTAQVKEWPKLAPNALYGLAGEIVRAIEPHTEADSVALLVQFLVAFGSCIGRGPFMMADGGRHGGNLFAVMVGVSSKGRKGTSWNRVRPLCETVAPSWAADRVLSGLSSGEGLIAAVRDPVESQVKNKKTGEMETVTTDAGVEDKRLLVMEGEFATVLRQGKRDGNTLSATIRNAWDTGILRIMTRTNPLTATGTHVSIVGHITADELRKELADTDANNGFGNRFLWVCVKRSKELPFGGNEKELAAALAPLLPRLQEAFAHAFTVTELVFDSKAREIWAAVYSELSAGKPGLLGAMTGRSESQVMRLSLLYALLDGATAIQGDHLTAALSLWEYCEASARFIFGDSLGDRVADDILRALRQKPEGMTRNDLRDVFDRHQSSERIGQALALLLEGRCIRSEKQDTAGRPAERWFAT